MWENCEKQEARNRMKKGLFAVVVMLMSCCYLSAQTEEFLNYYNEAGQYSLDYPKSWEVEETDEEGTVSLYAPSEENELVYKHLQVSIAQWDEGSLEEFVAAAFSEAEMRKVYPDIEIRDAGISELNGTDIHSFEMSYTLNEEKVITLCYFEKKESRVYIILAASPEREYALYKDSFLKIVRSLHIW